LTVASELEDPDDSMGNAALLMPDAARVRIPNREHINAFLASELVLPPVMQFLAKTVRNTRLTWTLRSEGPAPRRVSRGCQAGSMSSSSPKQRTRYLSIVAAHADEVLEQLAVLIERLPLPHSFWHRYVPEMHAVVVDARAALDALAGSPGAAGELHRQVQGEASYPEDLAGGPTIAAARARLRALPIPKGEHPYLDEILLALEAAEAALATLAAVEADETFAETLERMLAPSQATIEA
jgi:hypothetical protein